MTSTDTQPIPGLTEELVRLDHLRVRREVEKEIQRALERAEGADRASQLDIDVQLRALARSCKERGWRGLESRAYAAHRAVKAMR